MSSLVVHCCLLYFFQNDYKMTCACLLTNRISLSRYWIMDDYTCTNLTMSTYMYRMWGAFQANRQWFVRNSCIDNIIRIVQWNHLSRQVLPKFYQIQLIDRPIMFCIILNGKWKCAYFLNVKKSRGREGGQLNLKSFLL